MGPGRQVSGCSGKSVALPRAAASPTTTVGVLLLLTLMGVAAHIHGGHGTGTDINGDHACN